MLMMARTCQRLVTYALDFCLRKAAMIWLAPFSTGITQKSPSPLAVAVSTRPLLFVAKRNVTSYYADSIWMYVLY